MASPRPIAVALALCLVVASAKAQGTLDSREVAKAVTPAVVLIKGTTDSGDSLGTGFIVSSDGKIVTSLHVIQDLKTGGVQLTNGDRYDSFSVLAFDERRDLAVIKVPGFDLPVIELGNSNEIQQGDPVLVIGSPRGLEASISTGIVSAIRDVPAGFKVIQTDAAANPGNSGGPLVNSKGQAVGVVGFKLRDSENLNFTMPINYVRGLLGSSTTSMTLEQLRSRLHVFEDPFRSDTAYPSHWKSLKTGIVRKLRFDRDYCYYDLALEGKSSIIGELRKHGEKWAGTQFSTIHCKGWGSCSLEFPVEFITLSPTRIEGRVLGPPEGAKFSCRKCSYNVKKEKYVWRSFVWIPE